MLIQRGGPATPAKGAIVGGEWIYDTPTGAGWFAARLPSPEESGGDRVYQVGSLRLSIRAGACGDAALRGAYPDAVSVSGGDSGYRGCGGARRPPAGVQDSHWQVLRLGSAAAPADASPTIFTFAQGGGVGGTLACNDVGIATRWSEGRFSQPAGDQWLEGTMVGCEGPAVEFGRKFWSAMRRAERWERLGDRLKILFSDGSDAELRLIL
jgi:hypothetical protein